MKPEEANKLAKALEAKGATQPCARCGNRRFDIVGYTQIYCSEDPNTLNIGGPSVPVVLAGCSNCGNITQYAIKVLGL